MIAGEVVRNRECRASKKGISFFPRLVVPARPEAVLIGMHSVLFIFWQPLYKERLLFLAVSP